MMCKYTYYFNDGTHSTVEVDEKLYKLLKDFDKVDENANEYDTRTVTHRIDNIVTVNGNATDLLENSTTSLTDGVAFGKCETKGGKKSMSFYRRGSEKGYDTYDLKQMGLTPKEIRIINTFDQGFKKQDIAKALGVSPKTIQRVFSNFKEKLKEYKNEK